MDSASAIECLRHAFMGCEHEIASAWLFGSVARGTSRPGSDLDVAVLLDPAPERGTWASLRLDLRAELEARLGREVDLVVLNHAPPDLTHRVLRDGKLVIETDPSARVRFEVRARNAYFDLKPYLDEYRRAPGHSWSRSAPDSTTPGNDDERERGERGE